jgi:hypothetical protein
LDFATWCWSGQVWTVWSLDLDDGAGGGWKMMDVPSERDFIQILAGYHENSMITNFVNTIEARECQSFALQRLYYNDTLQKNITFNVTTHSLQ